tara:strand:- start:58479 stop:58811 length:333 start_codon:yes stop_codon:yes gene_type:complete
MLSVTCGTESGQQSSDDSLPEPWKSLNLDIDGAEVVRASSGELQLVFPFIKPEQMNLPYAMILDGMKKSGWEVIEQDYGKSGKVQAPGGKKYGMEVFAQDRRVVATIWAL